MSRNTRKRQRASQADTASNHGGEPSVVINNTGRVKHDDRGNAIWEWAMSTGEVSIETSTLRLKKLDTPGLALTDDGPSTNLVKGYSPYDSGVHAKPATRRKKKDLRRLSEWLKLKKQAESRKPDDE